MAAQPLLAVNFEQADQKYSLTSQGRLFVAYTSTAPSLEGEECWREVLAKYLPVREEPEP